MAHVERVSGIRKGGYWISSSHVWRMDYCDGCKALTKVRWKTTVRKERRRYCVKCVERCW